MNRAAILSVIDDELRKPIADTGSMRPLHEVARSVRDRLFQQDDSTDQDLHQHSGAESPSVISIGLVSQFADQPLSDELNRQVCDAATRDLSVLMELVAARRNQTTSSSSLPPINVGLQQRLKQMSSEAFPIPPTPSPPVTPSVHKKNPTQQVGVIVLVIATAALFSGVVFLLLRGSRPGNGDPKPGQMQVVNEDRIENVQPDLIESPEQVTHDNSPGKLATGPSDPPKSIIDEPRTDGSTELDSRNQNLQPRDAVADTLDPPNESIAMPVQPPINTDDDSGSDNVPTESKLVDAIKDFRWTQITGLMATRIVDPKRDSSYQSPWLTINEDSLSDSGQTFRVPVDLITLPSSRAEAMIGDSSIGPRRSSFVMASDSRCRVSTLENTASSNATQIELLHGAIALRRVAADSVVEIVGSGQQRLRVKWLSKASVVVQYGEHGLETHLDQGVVSINGQRRSDESMAWSVDGETISIQRLARMPVWTDRSVDSIRLPPAVLGQLRSSKNLLSDFSKMIVPGRASTNLSASDLSILARCQAAMNDQQLLRLASGSLPQQRQAVLQRLFGMPAWDPRYEMVWKAAGRRIGNDRQLQWLQTLAQMAQAGSQPNATQTDRLLTGLSGADVTVRSISDFLLRTFARGGPPYDPAWTGTAQTRSVAAWRKYLGR